jgi:hypothetical protein
MGLFMFKRIVSRRNAPKCVAPASLAAAAIVLAAAGSAQATTLNLSLTADNAFSAYLSTSDSTLGTLIGSGGDWTSTFNFSQPLAGTPLFLHVVAANGGGPDGFIGSFSLSDASYHFSNGSQALDTDTANWKADPWSGAWTTPAGAPVSFGANGVGPWGPRAGISGSAQWIWSSPDNGVAEFSTQLTGPGSGSVPEPASWAVMLLGMLGTGAVLRMRRGQSGAGAAV